MSGGGHMVRAMVAALGALSSTDTSAAEHAIAATAKKSFDPFNYHAAPSRGKDNSWPHHRAGELRRKRKFKQRGQKRKARR